MIIALPSLNLENLLTPKVMEKKKKAEATDFDDSFDYEDSFNINEVDDQEELYL